jgi:hypothetical protein
MMSSLAICIVTHYSLARDDGRLQQQGWPDGRNKDETFLMNWKGENIAKSPLTTLLETRKLSYWLLLLLSDI